MFHEDAKSMFIIYEPQEGMINESKNWKKKQIGFIHKACLEKASSMLKTKYEPDEGAMAEVV